MNDLKPFKQGEEGTHSICNKHNVKGKSICCRCSGEVGCGDEPMIHTDKILEKLEKKLLTIISDDNSYKYNPDIPRKENREWNAKNLLSLISPVIADSIQQAVAEERVRVREKIEKLIEHINWSHSVGSHSDDRGGDSDIECTCREDEVRYKTEAYKNVLRSLDKLTDKEKGQDE